MEGQCGGKNISSGGVNLGGGQKGGYFGGGGKTGKLGVFGGGEGVP